MGDPHITYEPRWPKPRTPMLQGGHPLARGLKWCIPFTEGGGTTVRDVVSGVSGVFTNLGTQDWAEGHHNGNGMHAPGLETNDGVTNEHIRFTADETVPRGTGTCMCIARVRLLPAGGDNSLMKSGAANSRTNANTNWAIERDDGSDQWEMSISNGSAQTKIPGGGTIVTDRIYTLVGTWDTGTADEINLYVNGVLAGNVTLAGVSMNTHTGGVSLGTSATSSAGGRGYSHHYFAAEWTRVLAPQEVADISEDPYQIMRPAAGRLLLFNGDNAAGGPAPSTADKGWFGWRHA